MVRNKIAQEHPGPEKGATKAKSNGAILLVAALDMSWRLAIAVLVPIVGGYALDKHFGITPVLTILGFLIAMVGVFLILKSTVANAEGKFKGSSR